MNKEKVLMFWSGGKDSAMALHEILKSERYEVEALITTINKKYLRVSMHGIREELVDEQAKEIGIPIIKMYVSEGTNEEYESVLKALLTEFFERGIKKVVFGDIFLEDLRAYRDKLLLSVGMKAIYPLWKKNTSELIRQFTQAGFRSVICCGNSEFFTEDEVGTEVDGPLVKSKWKLIDPCGENGEYHSFVFSGPVFRNPIPVEITRKIFKPLTLRDSENSKPFGFWFCEVVLSDLS